MTPNEKLVAAQELVDRLAVVVDGQPHQVILMALIAMYRTTAVAFPCCMQQAAADCAVIAQHLACRAANPSPSGHIH